jgi:hypothetical protein
LFLSLGSFALTSGPLSPNGFVDVDQPLGAREVESNMGDDPLASSVDSVEFN